MSNAMLVDSGADYSMLPRPWMRRLGISISECDEHPIRSASGKGRGWKYKHGPLKAWVYDMEIDLDAVFCNTHRAALGRGDFFNSFRVTLDHRSGSLRLEPYLNPA